MGRHLEKNILNDLNGPHPGLGSPSKNQIDRIHPRLERDGLSAGCLGTGTFGAGVPGAGAEKIHVLDWTCSKPHC